MLKSLREEKKLSQQMLADMVGVNRNAISYYENNNRLPNMLVFKRICDALSLSSEDQRKLLEDLTNRVKIN